MVATPFTTADRLLAVARRSGARYAAYMEANTPTVQTAVAAPFTRSMPIGAPLRAPAFLRFEGEGMATLARRTPKPCNESVAKMSRGRERRLERALTPWLNRRCVVGVSKAPTMVASDAASSSHRKSARAPAVAPASTLPSTRLASRGAWKEFAVRDRRTRALKRENARAMRRVRTPAIRAA